ncbi:MAG: hypothetical protein HC836_22795 [Richelia sp. RM2_1_2]|nr:hypothetical protein [Richelia sp. RM2_1_2]
MFNHDPNKNATFLPSISNMYVATLANINITREIDCLVPTKEKLNHLKNTGAFFYNWALYSYGHAKEYEEADV